MLNTKICYEQIKTVMRYCYTPIINRIKTDHGKLRMWSNWEPSYTDGGYVNCATILKIVWQFLWKLRYTYHMTSHFTTGNLLKRNQSICLYKHLHMINHSSFIIRVKHKKSTQMSIMMNGQIMVYLSIQQNASNRKEWTIDTCNIMNEIWSNR